MSNKDYICLHCKKHDDKTCKYSPDSNTVTCGSFYPHNAENKSKESIMNIKKTVNKIYEQGGHL